MGHTANPPAKNREVAMPESPTIHSVGTLARLFRVPVHRIQYVIRSRGIAHVGVAGNVRLFDAAAAQWIGSELKRIAADRQGVARMNAARNQAGPHRAGPMSESIKPGELWPIALLHSRLGWGARSLRGCDSPRARSASVGQVRLHCH